MKKALLFSVVAGTIGLYSCKKDGTTTTITKTVRDTTIINQFASGIVNADSLMAGVQVAHGSSVTGEFPAASTDAAAPVLDSLYKKTYTVVKSRYLVIYPPATSGYIAGYYVQIAGAKSYFKTDYTSEYGLKKAGARGDVEGFYDSSIVIKLPTTINGDTFYVKYAAYDSQNRVSKAITAIALVQPEADDAFTSKASGKWQYYSTNYYSNGQWLYENFQVDTGGIATNSYSCDNNQLSYNDEGNLTLDYQYYYSKRVFTIGKYSFSDDYYYGNKTLDIASSSCSNLVYISNNNSYNSGYGGYSYDQDTKKVTFIYEYYSAAKSADGQSNIGMVTATFKLIELTDAYLILADTNFNGDYNSEIRYYKYMKQ